MVLPNLRPVWSSLSLSPQNLKDKDEMMMMMLLLPPLMMMVQRRN
jgi:hypothetical protein